MRRKWILITVAVLIQAVLLVGCSKTKTPEITSIEQLNDKAYSVGVGEGAAGMFAVEEYLPEAEMLLYSSDVTGYAAVRQGELDAYAYDRIMMEFAIAGGVEGVRLLEGSLGETMDIAVGISPKTEIPNLTQKVNQFLRELRDEGTPIMLLGHVLVCAAYLLLVCIRKRVALPAFVKKVAPTFLIGLSTASSAAAYSTNVECCEKQLGIDRQIINFGIPLGQVVFMPGAAVIFLSAGLCMAEVYGVAISPAWLVSALLITVVLAVAAPPVPGGGLTCYTMLFLQLNIPSEAVAITLALNVILEFFGTAVNLFCLQAELVELAGSLDRLDVEMLRGK